MKLGKLSVLSAAALLAGGMTFAMAQSNPAPASGGSAPGVNSAAQGKCWDAAEKEVKLPKWEKMQGYANGLPHVLQRYCALWGRGT